MGRAGSRVQDVREEVRALDGREEAGSRAQGGSKGTVGHRIRARL